jgi:hypothetical protein
VIHCERPKTAVRKAGLPPQFYRKEATFRRFEAEPARFGHQPIRVPLTSSLFFTEFNGQWLGTVLAVGSAEPVPET